MSKTSCSVFDKAQILVKNRLVFDHKIRTVKNENIYKVRFWAAWRRAGRSEEPQKTMSNEPPLP